MISHPLPLPSLRPFDSLSAAELRTACIRYLHTRRNLASPQPVVRKWRVLKMQDQPRGSMLLGFELLPGEQHIMTYHTDGTVKIWDNCHLQPPNKRNWSPDAAKGVYHDPTYVGRSLATFDVGFPLGGAKHLVYGEEKRDIIVCALSNHMTLRGYDPLTMNSDTPTLFCIFRFIVEGVDQVTNQEIYRSSIRAGMALPGVSLSRDLAVLYILGDAGRKFLVVNLNKKSQVTIAQALPLEDFPSFGLGHINGPDFLFFFDQGGKLVVEAYLDLARHVPEASEAHSNLIVNLSYDVCKRIPCSTDQIIEWSRSTSVQRSRGHILLSSMRRSVDGYKHGYLWSAKHIDIPELLRRLSCDLEPENLIQDTKWAVHGLEWMVAGPAENDLVTRSSGGTNLAWISSSDAEKPSTAHLKLEMVRPLWLEKRSWMVLCHQACAIWTSPLT
ncbi:hypothetical protein FRB94_009003 [Tulasnella sp. JGI-2019a]|nr:hypothetical protein FRB94_009003 [Tulasnella sp. JGI-2019a]